MKYQKIITLFIVFLFSVNIAFSQNIEPLELAKRIFTQNSEVDIQKYAIGEYEGEPSWKDVSPNAKLEFELISQTSDKAVVGMTISDENGVGFDSYLFFVKDNSVWKMSNFRTLAQIGILQQMVNSFSKLSPSEIEKLLKTKDPVNPNAIFESREDFDFTLENAKLTIDLDKNIIAHFNKNKAEFECLKDEILKEIKKPKNEQDDFLKTLQPAYRKLYVAAISTDYIGFENCIDFIIGGIGDNLVGYIYVLDKKDLPNMNPSSIIMIKEIGNGWYLYKTT